MHSVVLTRMTPSHLIPSLLHKQPLSEASPHRILVHPDGSEDQSFVYVLWQRELHQNRMDLSHER